MTAGTGYFVLCEAKL